MYTAVISRSRSKVSTSTAPTTCAAVDTHGRGNRERCGRLQKVVVDISFNHQLQWPCVLFRRHELDVCSSSSPLSTVSTSTAAGTGRAAVDKHGRWCEADGTAHDPARSILNGAVGRDRSLPCPNAAGASSCGDGVLAGAEVEGCLGDVNPLDPLDPGIQGWGREEYPGLRGGDGIGKKSVDPGMGSGRVSIQGWCREECRSRDGIGKSIPDGAVGMGSGRVSRIARWGWDREECLGLRGREEGSVGGGMTVERDDDGALTARTATPQRSCSARAQNRRRGDRSVGG